MSLWFLLLAFAAAINPARVRLGLPEDRAGRGRIRPLTIGIVITFLLGMLGVAVADRLLTGIDVSPETFRIAAGVVMAVAAGWVLVVPQRAAEPELAGWGAGLVPVTFPLLVSPELFVLTLSAGADEPAPRVLGALACGLVAVLALGAMARGDVATPVLRASSRLTAAVLMVVAIALMVSGIRDV